MLVPNSSKPAAGERQKVALPSQLALVWALLPLNDREILEILFQEGTAKGVARRRCVDSVRTVEDWFEKIEVRADDIVDGLSDGERTALEDWKKRKRSVKLQQIYTGGCLQASTAGLRQPWDPPEGLSERAHG